MGNEGYKNNYNDFALNVKEELMDDIQKELMIKKRKKSEKHFKKLVKKKLKGKINKANFFEKFNKNEKGIKNISQLLNSIYDQNTDLNFKREVGRTFYEGVFGIKKISGLQPEKNFGVINNNLENNYNFKEEINDNEVHNSFNEQINNINNNQEEFEEENPYKEYENIIQENPNLNNFNNLKAGNRIYNSNINNNINNFSNRIQYEKPNDNIESRKFVRVSKIPNVEFIENNQFDLNHQNIPLDKDDINYDLKNNQMNVNYINNNYNQNNNFEEINYNNNNNIYEQNNSFNNFENINIYNPENNLKQSENIIENNIINPYEVKYENYINNQSLINDNAPINQKPQIYTPIIKRNHKLVNNNNNQYNDDSIAVVTKIAEPHNTDENIHNQESNYDNELNDININKNKYNDIKEQQKLRYNLMNTNIKNEKEKIIYSKVSNVNKFIYKNEEEKNNNINKDNEIYNKNNNLKIIEKTPKKDFEISRENDINYNSKSNNKTKTTTKNEINREISLDYSDISKSKSKSKSKEASNKKDIYEVSNENDIEIIKSKYPKDSQKKKENTIFKKNNIITNININNFPEKIKHKNKIKKNVKKSISKDKTKKKDKSKPKYSIQINLKDLINEDIKEKSKLSPDKRYADIEMRRRTKNKANSKFKDNKPFRFNMNDDY